MSFKKKLKDNYYQEVNIDLDELKKDISFVPREKKIKMPRLGLSLGALASVFVIVLIVLFSINNMNSKQMANDEFSHPTEDETWHNEAEKSMDNYGGGAGENTSNESSDLENKPENQEAAPNQYDAENSGAISEESSRSIFENGVASIEANDSTISSYIIASNRNELADIFSQYSKETYNNQFDSYFNDYKMIVVSGNVEEVEEENNISIKKDNAKILSIILVEKNKNLDVIEIKD